MQKHGCLIEDVDDYLASAAPSIVKETEESLTKMQTKPPVDEQDDEGLIKCPIKTGECKLHGRVKYIKPRKLSFRNHFLMDHGAKISDAEIEDLLQNPDQSLEVMFCQFGGHQACDFATLRKKLLDAHVEKKHADKTAGQKGGKKNRKVRVIPP